MTTPNLAKFHQDVVAELTRSNGDLAVALVEMRRRRAGIERAAGALGDIDLDVAIDGGAVGKVYEQLAVLLEPVDLT